jgi:hypothetical protein
MYQQDDRQADALSAKEGALRFLDMLRRFNAKERNFLTCYALSPILSPQFVRELTDHLQEIGLTGLECAKVVYFGMDYHLEWIYDCFWLLAS